MDASNHYEYKSHVHQQLTPVLSGWRDYSARSWHVGLGGSRQGLCASASSVLTNEVRVRSETVVVATSCFVPPVRAEQTAGHTKVTGAPVLTHVRDCDRRG